MIPYTLYLDYSAGKDTNGYFEVSVVSVEPFTEQQIDEMVVTRKSWGEVKLKNTPFNSVMLYDTIQAKLPTDEIHLKLVSAYETIIGYFGCVDCKVDDDHKVLTIKLTMLDQYTQFLEGREKEVKLFDDANIIANGKFNSFTDGTPLFWTKNTPETVTNQIYFLNETALVLPRIFDLLAINSSGVYQSRSFALKGRNIVLSFLYALSGDTLVKENLQFKLVLTGSVNSYDLTKDGKWIAYDPLYKSTYRTSTLPIPQTSISNFYRFNLVSDLLPEDGSIALYLYHQSDTIFSDNTNLILTQVRVETPLVEFKTVSINFNDDNLVSVEQKNDKIKFKDKNASDSYFKYFGASTINISDYFNGDGSPNISALASAMSSHNSLTYSDLKTIFESKNSSSYKFELSKLTIYHGQYSGGKRNYFGIAEYSREEVYLSDPDNWDGNTETLIPPATNSGWDWTTEFLNGKRLWVRTPFNSTISTWVLEDKITALNSTHPEYYFIYHYSQTSKKQYPITAAKSVDIKTSIDFREVIRKVYCGTDESLIGKNVYSTFFWNDSQTVEIQSALFPDGVTTKNYVSGELVNPLNKIAAIHTNDISTEPFTDEEKSVLKISGKKLIDDLKVLFPQLYWYIDADHNLHIEHIKFFDLTNNVKSLLGSQYNYIRNYKQWDYVKDKMFSLEEYEVKNAGYNDFKTSKITFDKIVSNKRGEDIKGSYTTQNLTTDIQFCVENPNSLDNGIILVCYETVNAENIVKYGNGQKTNKVVINGDLSISTLLKKYARYEGTYLLGKINDESCSFEYTKRVRAGSEIEIKGIFTDKIVLNNIGRGLLKSATVDYKNENTKALFTYRYATNDLSNGINSTTGETEIIDSGGGDFIIRTAPTVLTNPLGSISEIDNYFFVFANGTVLTDGDSPIEERGVCYSLSANPTILDTTSVSDGFIGSFSRKLKIYVAGTYYLKAYATNAIGMTAYGEEVTFTLTFTIP